MKTKIKINGLKTLEKKLNKIENDLKIYEEEKIMLPFSQKQWNNLTDVEKNEAIQEAQRDYMEKIKKDLII